MPGVVQADIEKMQELFKAREASFQSLLTKREEAEAATKAYEQAKNGYFGNWFPGSPVQG